jgi:hypothetical protein
MDLFFRGMAAQNEAPKIGRSARCLGIRPGIDIDVGMLPIGIWTVKGICCRKRNDQTQANWSKLRLKMARVFRFPCRSKVYHRFANLPSLGEPGVIHSGKSMLSKFPLILSRSRMV